jgi:hypothetical protein
MGDRDGYFLCRMEANSLTKLLNMPFMSSQLWGVVKEAFTLENKGAVEAEAGQSRAGGEGRVTHVVGIYLH